MKKKEKESLRSQTIEQLRKQVAELQQKLASTQASRYTKPSKNVREVRVVRKKIATMLTLMKEKELYEQQNNKE